jgi:hypothetical protein
MDTAFDDGQEVVDVVKSGLKLFLTDRPSSPEPEVMDVVNMLFLTIGLSPPEHEVEDVAPAVLLQRSGLEPREIQ